MSNDYEYAKRLAICTWEKHYKDEAPNWKPLDTLHGVLSQIDNMLTGMKKISTHYSCSTCTYEHDGYAFCENCKTNSLEIDYWEPKNSGKIVGCETCKNFGNKLMCSACDNFKYWNY